MQFHKGISQTLIPISHQGQMCCTVAKGVNTELGGRFQYSDLILSTTLEPDIDMWSPEGKKIVLMELTEPWKKGRHQRGKQVQGAGWLLWLLPIGISPSNLSGITRKNLLLWNRKEVSYEPEDEQWIARYYWPNRLESHTVSKHSRKVRLDNPARRVWRATKENLWKRKDLHGSIELEHTAMTKGHQAS